MRFERIQNSAPSIPNLVMESLLKAIEDGVVKVNQELPPERELAEALGVGRGSLRESLAVLSFMGMGLTLETVSWGSMLSLAEKALMSGSWWMILIPGMFLVVLMMCITNVGNWLRKRANPKENSL